MGSRRKRNTVKLLAHVELVTFFDWWGWGADCSGMYLQPDMSQKVVQSCYLEMSIVYNYQKLTIFNDLSLWLEM